MRNFESRFNRRRKLVYGMFFFNALVILSMFVLGGMLLYNIFINPEAIGEFFGRIVGGFQSVNK